VGSDQATASGLAECRGKREVVQQLHYTHRRATPTLYPPMELHNGPAHEVGLSPCTCRGTCLLAKERKKRTSL